MRVLVGGLAALSLGWTGAATAGTATASMTVSATANGTCSVAAAPLAFGTYGGTQVDAAAAIATTCSSGTRYDIALDGGTGGGAERRLAPVGAGTGTLAYGLYSDAARTSAWGRTPGVDTVAGTGTGAAGETIVYGRIPARQQVADGAYADMVTVTVSF